MKEQIRLSHVKAKIKTPGFASPYRIAWIERLSSWDNWTTCFRMVDKRSFRDEDSVVQEIYSANEKAIRKRQSKLQSRAEREAKRDRRREERREKREEFRSWVDKRFGYLSEIYRESQTTIFAGKSDYLRDKEEEFHRWVPTYLSKQDMQNELSTYKEKKQSLDILY